MQEEIFKPVLGYENLYEISSHGRVKSLAKKWLNGSRSKDETLLKPSNTNGYPRVVLSGNGNKKKSKFVHILVAEVFFDNPNGYPIVNHLNSNTKDAYFENLEWTTYKGNAIHAFKSGTRKGMKGINHPMVKYSERDIKIIRRLYNDGKYKQPDIADMFETNQSSISRILLNKRWKHI